MTFLASNFFHESVSPRHLSIPLGPFRISRKFVEIFANECLSGVSMTLAIIEKNVNFFIFYEKLIYS
jgi:hypothetical protein